jgi:hypothetical protein
MASEPPKVFISYNRADRDWAEWIAGVIDHNGYQPIIQAWDFRPGQNFVLRMQEATAEAGITIAVLSEAYLKAEFTQPEWAAAFAQDPKGEKRKLIPVRVSPCSLPGMFKPIIYVDLVNLAEEDAERALLDGLKPSGKPPSRRRSLVNERSLPFQRLLFLPVLQSFMVCLICRHTICLVRRISQD